MQIVRTPDREAVGLMLQGLGGTIDLIIPRGGRSLVERVQQDARVPVLGHLEGVCHTYVHAAADPAMAADGRAQRQAPPRIGVRSDRDPADRS